MSAAAARGRVDIALDCRMTSHMSAGMQLYVRKLRELVPRVAPDLRLAFIGGGDNFDLAEQFGLPLEIARLQPRLTHFPTPFVPLAAAGRFIVTVHDTIDLHYPAFGKRKVGPYYRYIVAPVARRARAVITDDRATTDDLERFLHVDPARVRVIALGVDLVPPAELPVRNARPYFLYVGNHRPHKNVATLVRAWTMLPDALAADLYLTGVAPGDGTFAGQTRSNGKFVFLGDPSDAELVALYAGACAYVHPALREGFGLPMLEAMRVGTPVLAARSALPEILAAHAWSFAPTDASELCALLLGALSDSAQFDARAAAAQIATRELTWERTARATVEIYREFLA